jgi:hypothetical protein
MFDPPPMLRPEERPTEAELVALAKELLREQAAYDAVLAEEMRARGIDPDA